MSEMKNQRPEPSPSNSSGANKPSPDTRQESPQGREQQDEPVQQHLEKPRRRRASNGKRS